MTEILNFPRQLQAWWAGVVDWLTSPLWRVYIIVGAIVLLCVFLAFVIRLFLGEGALSRGGRILLGAIAALAVAFAAGARAMNQTMQSRLEHERQKRREEEEQRPQERSGGGWFPPFGR